MPDPGPPETLGDTVETSDDDHEGDHSRTCPAQWQFTLGMETVSTKCLLRNLDDPVVTRRGVVAQRLPTVAEEEEIRQKRMRSEPVPELFPLFPLTGEELSEDVFEILIDLFASPGSEHCQDSRGSEHCRRFSLVQNIVKIPTCSGGSCENSRSRSCQTAEAAVWNCQCVI